MEEEISLMDLFKVLKQRIKTIVFWSLFGLLISGAITFFVITPTYESSSRIVVNQIQNSSQTITNTDIQTNLSLINTYQSIIKEPIILEDVLAKTTSNITIDNLRAKINVQTEANSLVFGINVQDENPYIAADLANAVAESFEEKIGDILEVESVTILSEAVPSMRAVSPSVSVNLAIGLLLGMLFGVVVTFISEFMDKRVKDTKIIEDLGWISLGSIFEMSETEMRETRLIKRARGNQNHKPRTRRI